MPRRLWLRIGIVVAVAVVSVVSLYPPKKKINLGLDLQGGIHLVLGVDAAKVLAAQLDRVAEDLKGAFDRKGVAATRVARDGGGVVVQLASPQAWSEASGVTDQYSSYERRQEDRTAGSFVLQPKPATADKIIADSLSQVIERLRNRVDKFGVAEPTITKQGTDRVLIQLPGIQDAERAKALIGQTGLLEFKLVERFVDSGTDLAALERTPALQILPHRVVDPQTKTERLVPYAVIQRAALLTGASLSQALVQADTNAAGNWQVALRFNPEGARKFAEITENNVGRNLAIVLDGVVNSAPRINERIPGGEAVITGRFTIEQAQDLKIVLNEGALPAPVTILEERTVGPSLGADSIRAGLRAILASTVIVFLFMVVYYRLSGLIADVALGLNLLLLLACMAGFGATLTLPGIAGIALTIGMAVDTNILIFERIREELRVGKTTRAAIQAGFTRAFRAIIDTHVTVLLTALVLYGFGTGPVKGFAVSLGVGLLASLFTAVFFTRLLFDLFYMGRRTLEAISI
ncbi:MAG: protein translocase subunit SecD [Candidatus Rokubacteria bacterium]|nr:protein translocase subunit SecD [Candidatus Rokubacteria bacterium]MBI3824804.1 protein translocase subunit SecD [Candidatus Rokubacteria bacterium]